VTNVALRERMVDLAYGAGWGLVNKIPEGIATRAFRSGADLVVRRGGPSVAQYRRNLARVVPTATTEELDELVRAGMRSYARYWRETFRLSTMDHRAVVRTVDKVVLGKEVVDAALDRGKGVVLALPHTGNFDVSGIWLVGHYGGFTTVAERLRPESLFQRFLRYRQSLGFEILPLTGGPVSPYRTMVQRLHENKVICLVCDRDLTSMGIPVTFFGEQTRMPAGPARLAAATGAQLVIVDSSFTDDGWGLRFHTPREIDDKKDVPELTQHVADSFEADIAVNPVDWHMLQKLWIADLSEDRRRALTVSGQETG
jgi:lauroyl/myristoyl acyltransferase